MIIADLSYALIVRNQRLPSMLVSLFSPFFLSFIPVCFMLVSFEGGISWVLACLVLLLLSMGDLGWTMDGGIRRDSANACFQTLLQYTKITCNHIIFTSIYKLSQLETSET